MASQIPTPEVLAEMTYDAGMHQRNAVKALRELAEQANTAAEALANDTFPRFASFGQVLNHQTLAEAQTESAMAMALMQQAHSLRLALLND